MTDILAIAGVVIAGAIAHFIGRRMTKPLRQSGVLVAGAIVAGLFVSGIGLLYRLNEGYVPEELDRAFYPALAVMLAGIVILAHSLRLSDGSQSIYFQQTDWFGLRRRHWQAQYSKWQLERIKALEADPRRRKYAARIRAGEHWSDDAIEYDLNPGYLASCEHLQPYERAMREAGISINLSHTHYLFANCRLDLPGLDAMLERPEGVDFAEMPGDRPGEPWSAMLYCKTHRRAITVVHADEARAETAWFPARPKGLALPKSS